MLIFFCSQYFLGELFNFLLFVIEKDFLPGYYLVFMMQLCGLYNFYVSFCLLICLAFYSPCACISRVEPYGLLRCNWKYLLQLKGFGIKQGWVGVVLLFSNHSE